MWKGTSERLDGIVIAVTVDGNGTGTATVVDPGTVLVASTTTYDANGRVTASTQFAGHPTAEATTTYEYDVLGRTTQVTDALGHFTRSEYDASGRVTVQWDAAGQPTYFAYDGDGRVSQTTFADGAWAKTAYDSLGRRASETVLVDWGTPADGDEVTQTTGYGYDSLGRLTTVTPPAVVDAKTGLMAPAVYTYGYDTYGNQVSIADPYGRETLFRFDAYGRPTGRTLPGDNDPATNETEITKYLPTGEVDYTIDFHGNKTDPVYDFEVAGGTTLGRLVRTDYYEPGGTEPAIVMAYTYDPFGRRDTVTEMLGTEVRVTDYDYDVAGRTIRITSPEGVINYGYDDSTGRQTAMWTDTTRVEYGYDLLGRMNTVTEAVRAGVTLADPQVTTYTFDELGMVSTVTVSAGAAVLRQTTNAYDPDRHWLIGVENRDGAGNLLSEYDYTRRADGQVVQVDESVKQPDGSFESGTGKDVYDGMNRLAREEYDGSAVGSDYSIDYQPVEKADYLRVVGPVARIASATASDGPRAHHRPH